MVEDGLEGDLLQVMQSYLPYTSSYTALAKALENLYYLLGFTGLPSVWFYCSLVIPLSCPCKSVFFFTKLNNLENWMKDATPFLKQKM